jgi:hypothetical protein
MRLKLLDKKHSRQTLAGIVATDPSLYKGDGSRGCRLPMTVPMLGDEQMAVDSRSFAHNLKNSVERSGARALHRAKNTCSHDRA